MLEATHVTARAIRLWYGATSPMMLPAGTPVQLLDHDEHVARIRYEGIDASHATVDVDAIAGLAPAPLADSSTDASEDPWPAPKPTAGSTPSGDSRRSSAARSSTGTPPPSRSSRPRRSPTATGSSRSSSRRPPTSSVGSSTSTSATTSSGVDARTPLEQLLAGEPVDQRYLAALKHLADAGALPADTLLELDTDAGTVRLAAADPSGDRRSVPDIG